MSPGVEEHRKKGKFLGWLRFSSGQRSSWNWRNSSPRRMISSSTLIESFVLVREVRDSIWVILTSRSIYDSITDKRRLSRNEILMDYIKKLHMRHLEVSWKDLKIDIGVVTTHDLEQRGNEPYLFTHVQRDVSPDFDRVVSYSCMKILKVWFG